MSDLDDWGLDGSDDLDLGFLDEPLSESEPSNETPPKPSKLPLNCKVVAITVCGLISIGVTGLYNNYITYPKAMVVEETSTGRYALEKYQESLPNFSGGKYTSQEEAYANGSEAKLAFLKRILSSVSYTPNEVCMLNVYGNPLINRGTKEQVMGTSYVDIGEEVTLSYVDYSSIKVTVDEAKKFLAEAGVTYGDVDYENKVIDAFCNYICSIKDLPIKQEKHIPSLVQQDTGYVISEDEDIYLDTVLFSSDEFRDLLLRFSEAASDGKLESTVEWLKWDSDKSGEEPSKYPPNTTISTRWCGAYYLQNELKENGELVNLKAQLGDGTLENPASYDTGIVTGVVKGEDFLPIRISLKEYGVSSEAVKWLESKDIRNRGIDTSSELQYCYYTFEVTNLSDKTLTIKDNSGICDANANLSPRAGNFYGLQGSVTLKPYESGVIESWNRSTELNRKYVIWGANFDRKYQPVWFRLLQGDLEDTSEEKGVELNKTREVE